MAEVPEHLLRRSRERREALGAAPSGGGGGAGEGGADASPPAGDDDGEKIPASLLTGHAATPAAAGAAPATAAAPAAAAVAAPPPKGPEGHTQSLLPVVKAGAVPGLQAPPTATLSRRPHLLAQASRSLLRPVEHSATHELIPVHPHCDHRRRLPGLPHGGDDLPAPRHGPGDRSPFAGDDPQRSKRGDGL